MGAHVIVEPAQPWTGMVGGALPPHHTVSVEVSENGHVAVLARPGWRLAVDTPYGGRSVTITVEKEAEEATTA